MKTTEAQVIQIPTEVILICPHCHEELEFLYKEFCDRFGEPCDWDYSKVTCWDCSSTFEIYDQSW